MGFRVVFNSIFDMKRSCLIYLVVVLFTGSQFISFKPKIINSLFNKINNNNRIITEYNQQHQQEQNDDDVTFLRKLDTGNDNDNVGLLSSTTDTTTNIAPTFSETTTIPGNVTTTTLDIATNTSFDSTDHLSTQIYTPAQHLKNFTLLQNHTESITSTRIPDVCITGRFGRNCNAMIEIANALYLAGTNYSQDKPRIGLNQKWSYWYKMFFEPRDDILMYYDYDEANCRTKIDAEWIYFIKDCPFNERGEGGACALHQFSSELFRLQPKQSIKLEAMNALDEIRRNHSKMTGHDNVTVVTVHRRDMEGKCRMLANRHDTFCFDGSDNALWENKSYENLCDVVYPNVTQDLAGNDVLLSNDHVIVLFTDGQRSDLDHTFPFIDTHPFEVQLWMMALSDIHYANPISSISYVVAHWRLGKETKPAECFQASKMFNTTVQYSGSQKSDRKETDNTLPASTESLKTIELLQPTNPSHQIIRGNVQSTSDKHVMGDSTVHPLQSNNTSMHTRIPDVCITGKFGRNCNKMIEIANALYLAGTNYSHDKPRIGLNLKWSIWYRQFFEPRDDILMYSDYDEANCRTKMDAEWIYFIKDCPFDENGEGGACALRQFLPELFGLQPKQSIKLEAMNALDSIRRNHSKITGYDNVTVVTVHRRDMEGKCRMLANRHNTFCFDGSDNALWENKTYEKMCDIIYPNVTQDLARNDGLLSNDHNVVVLFTDYQRPDLDNTFPLFDTHPFEVQLWMMAMSDIHYGTPVSSVDYVVTHWRGSKETRPESCYRDYVNLEHSSSR